MNNAGIGGAYTWDQTIAVNLTGVYYGTFHGAALLAERGGGSIINTASIAGLAGLLSGNLRGEEVAEGAGAYVAAKHGVVGSRGSSRSPTAQWACGSMRSVRATSTRR